MKGKVKMENVNEELKIQGGWLLVGGIHTQGCTDFSQSDKQRQVNTETRSESAEWKGASFCSSIDEAKSVMTNRARAFAILSKVCAKTRIGYFCPYDREKELEEAVNQVNLLISKYNDSAKFTMLWTDLAVVEISSKDKMAARAIWQEAHELLEELQEALEKTNAKDIKKVLGKIRGIKQIFPKSQEDPLNQIVEEVKLVTRKLEKEAEKLDEAATEELTKNAFAPVRGCRLLFAEKLEASPYEISFSQRREIKSET